MSHLGCIVYSRTNVVKNRVLQATFIFYQNPFQTERRIHLARVVYLETKSPCYVGKKQFHPLSEYDIFRLQRAFVLLAFVETSDASVVSAARRY
jgi:hypothetical protein